MPPLSGQSFYGVELNQPKQDAQPPPCFAWVAPIWGLFVAAVMGMLVGGNEAVALICLVAVPLGVRAWDKKRRCEGRFGDRPYSREDEPGLYWLRVATGIWSAIALLWGAVVLYDLLFHDGVLTGVGLP